MEDMTHSYDEPAFGSDAAVYMMRATQQHHIHLSSMADVKANILITASSILLSVIIALSASDGFRASLAFLATLTVTGLFFAVVSVLPKFGRRPAPGNNILFFGVFAHMSEDEFIEELADIVAEESRVFEAQAREIHQLGTYLHESKYRWLRVAYLSFLVGLVGGGVLEAFYRMG